MKVDREIKVRCSACGHLTRIPTVTNADRIRAMTDDELAKFISGKARGFGEEYEGYMSALDWLQEPIEDELI